MTEGEVRRRPGGRSARVRRAVLDATLELLVEKAAEPLSIGDVAARAGVHETSIYRRWGTREKLVIDALLSHSAHELPIPDTGSLRDDLAELARTLIQYLSTPLGASQERSLASASEDPFVAEMRVEFWKQRMDAAGVLVTRAIERGEVPPTTDPPLVIEMVVAPIHFRTLLTHHPLDGSLAQRIADVIVDGIAGRSVASTRS
jgi:AcrR family transcriptional regulator